MEIEEVIIFLFKFPLVLKFVPLINLWQENFDKLYFIDKLLPSISRVKKHGELWGNLDKITMLLFVSRSLVKPLRLWRPTWSTVTGANLKADH